MNNRHRSEKIERLRGRYCRITFTDGRQAEGTVYFSELRERYALKDVKRGDIFFRKSHVKKIEALTERGTR